MLHVPYFNKVRARLDAAELNVFVGHDYVVTLPNVPLKPVGRLFAQLEANQERREQYFSKGSGYVLYEILSELFDYCFPILDKIGFKLDRLTEAIFTERRSEDVVRDISDVKQEIVAYRKVIKPERSTLRLLERDALPAGGPRGLLRRHRRQGRADLGPARQLQGGRRGARDDQRVGDRAQAERHPADPDDLLGDPAAADADHRHLRDELRPHPVQPATTTGSSITVAIMLDRRERRCSRYFRWQALDMTERLWAPWRLEYVQGGADAGGLHLLRRPPAATTRPTWSCTAASTPTCS